MVKQTLLCKVETEAKCEVTYNHDMDGAFILFDAIKKKPECRFHTGFIY